MKNEPYRPSNSDAGEHFVHHFCRNCSRGKYEHDPDAEPCSILMASLFGDAEEWVYDEDGDPACTAFRRWKWFQDFDGNWNGPPEIYHPDPNQTQIPFP